MGKESQEKSVVAACCVRAMSFLAVGVIAAGCSGAMTGSPAALAQADAAARNYRLAPGDKVHVAVFNEANLSGDYVIEPDGHITLPLAGSVTAAGLTVPQLQLAVVKTLGNGFVQDPSVTVTAIDVRPYYILGEVNKPGRYSYSPDLTVMQAVATAEGFTYRADNTAVYIRHKSDPSESEVSLTATTAVLPGDTIRVAQRYF
jgi:polysaccharide export outer membrane protein